MLSNDEAQALTDQIRATMDTLAPRRRSEKQSRKYIEAYAQIRRDHPDWSVKTITEYLVKIYPALTKGGQKFGHQDTGRLRMWADAPAPFREAFYAGLINASAGNTLLNGKYSRHVSEAHRLNLLTKIEAGLIAPTAPMLRRVLAELPALSPAIQTRWLDPAQAMTFDDLIVAIADENTVFEAAAARSEEFIKRTAAADKSDFGVRTEKWIENLLERELPAIEAELPAIMAIGFRARLMAERFDELSKRFWVLGQRARNKGEVPEERPAATGFTVVDGSLAVDADVIDI